MKTSLAIALLAVGYAIVYCRLMVKFYYEKQHGVRESPFGAIFSFPPHRALPERGRKYARRYWAAVALLALCVLALARVSDFSYLAYIPF